MDRKKELLVRMYLVMLAFVILSIVIVARVAKVAIVEGDEWREKGNSNVQLRPVYAERGNIYSEEFNLLATSLKFFEIYMDPTVSKEKTFYNNVDSLAYLLSTSIGKGRSAFEWSKKLKDARKKGKQYVSISRKVSIDDYNQVKEFPIFRLGRFGGGFVAKKYEERTKPFKHFASRTIGRDRENATNVGLEEYFDKELTGQTQQVLMKKVKSADGGVWIPVYDMSELEQRRGQDIVTTLNVGIQDIVHNEVLKRAAELKVKKATAIVMEVETGAIKAISNFQMTRDSNYAEMYNDAVGTLSEPGSTFKLATTMALMDDGYCDLDTKVDLQKGKAKFYDRYVHDSDYHGKEVVTMKRAFEMSSNVGMAKLSHEFYNNDNGKKKFVEKLHQFGLTERTGVEITGEGMPYIKHPVKDKAKWYGTTIPWMSHGYELTVTPLQMLNLYNAVANDGKMMKPYMVSEVLEDDETVRTFKPKVLRQSIAKPQVVDAAQELLQSVVENGTGKRLKSDKVSIAGKTGTTVVNYSNRNASRKKYNASFAGYFPLENPKYSMIVIMYEPQGNVFYGANAAGPAYKKIAERIMALDRSAKNDSRNLIASNELPKGDAGFRPDFEEVFDYVGLSYKKNARSRWVEVDPYELNMNIEKKKISTKTVPDVRGMGARDAIYVLENLGLKVDLRGVGKVIKQTLKPGSDIKGQQVTIYLN